MSYMHMDFWLLGLGSGGEDLWLNLRNQSINQSINMHIYIYIERERERERTKKFQTNKKILFHTLLWLLATAI